MRKTDRILPAMTSEHAPKVSDYVTSWSTSVIGRVTDVPWMATSQAEVILEAALKTLGSEFHIDGIVAIHRTATVESGAVIKGPAIIGEGAFIASNAYLRGGVFVDRECIVGPCCEIKTTFMLSCAKVAHLSFVGDSIIGARANIEAGAIVANYRNELADKSIRILIDGKIVDTGIDKFGALVGDNAKVGANAVIAPGALIERGRIIPRLSLLDQHPG